MRPTLTQTRREMARGSRDALATMLLLTGPRRTIMYRYRDTEASF